jgi:23S rRNA pseudouridine2604 synthase
MERLNKYLAACGVCSRREADRLIEEGRVTINGKPASMQVSDGDEVFVNGKQIHGKNEKVVLAYYKPVGVTCTEKDKFADKKITDVVKFPVRVTYAGRLDKDSEGLLLLTNDGDLIDAMMRGSAGHEKEYLVKVNKEITEEFLEKMAAGVRLPELNLTTRPCVTEKIGKFTFRIILTQGVNRQIRRMSSELGYHVNAIKRIRVVNIQLANLKPGEYRQIKGEELQVLYNYCHQKLK